MKLASEQEEREIQALFEQGRTAEEERVQQLWERLHGIDLQYADAQRASRRKDRIMLAQIGRAHV